MNSHSFAPRDNYERNFNMIKHFCSKSLVLMLIILMFLNIISSVYVMFSSYDQFESIILNITFSKLNISFNTVNQNSLLSILNILANGFFLYCFVYIYLKSKNEDIESSPQAGIFTLYFVTILSLAIYGILFFLLLVTISIIIIKKPESLSTLPGLLNMTPEEIKSNKLSIVMVMIAIDAALFLKLWITQSQVDFLKSIKISLTESVPKNKGAHTYGVFSMIIGITLICSAAITTFLYYCYKDAFGGMGIKISDIYVFISLVLAYVRGFIPIIIGILAFSYSNIVDDTNTYGTLYTDYRTIGNAVDPNFQRSSLEGSSNKFIR